MILKRLVVSCVQNNNSVKLLKHKQTNKYANKEKEEQTDNQKKKKKKKKIRENTNLNIPLLHTFDPLLANV